MMPNTEIIKRIWNSATFMTWAGNAVRIFGLVLLIPLVLVKFSSEDIVVWQLFLTILSLQLLFDMGFAQTFSRIIAYSMSGLAIEDLHSIKTLSSKHRENSHINWSSISKIINVMKRIYLRLILLSFIVTAVLGTWAISEPIMRSTNPQLSWYAWGVVVIFAMLQVYGNLYSAIIQGMNEITILQRWQALFSFFSLAAGSITIALGGNLLEFIIAYQIWPVINILLNIRIKRNLVECSNKTYVTSGQYREILNVVWPPVWRSSIGIIMSVGLIQISGIIYANLGNTSEVASYLLGIQLIRVISSFSQAPFYTKIPVFSKYYAQGNIHSLVKLAKRGMQISYAVYIIGFIATGMSAAWLLNIIGSNVLFPDMLIWSTLGIAVFFERYGAMHIQLYASSNHVIIHIANGVCGILMIAFAYLFYPKLEILAFPLSMLLGYAGFYGWYAALHSYREYSIKIYNFESRAALPALIILILGIMVMT